MKRYLMLLVVLLTWANAAVSFGQGVVINEVQSANTTVIEDESGDSEDWIELYNAGNTAVNLGGYGLSDDQTLAHKWIFPSMTIGPKQYLLVWASNKSRAIAGNPLHTNFRLNASGGIVMLTDPGGGKADFVNVPELFSNISYGRLPDGSGSLVFFEKCTPKAANSAQGFSELLHPPIFSADSGFYTQGFSLNLTPTSPGSLILYTLDGSEPDLNNLAGTTYSYKNQYPGDPGQMTGPLLQKSYQTLQYSAPITVSDRSPLPNKIASISTTYHFDPYYIPEGPIFKGTIVRAKLIKPGAVNSRTITKCYFVTPQGSTRFSLPVVSISISEDELFDYYKGINVAGVDFDNWRIKNPNVKQGSKEGIGNYHRKEDEDERRANFIYMVNGKEIVNQDLGISIHGGGSRIMQSKGIGVYPRSKYGNNAISCKIFSDLDNTEFKRLVLRNSGTDFPYTMFRDAFCQELCKSLRCERESYQPAVIFINGEYWGILNIREKYTDEYFSEMYNIGKNEIDFIHGRDSAEEGDDVDYLNMIDYFNNNSLVPAANYNYIKTRLDPESFMDFFIANIYLLNTDWPDNNVQCWRKKTQGFVANAPLGHDGRWRWAFHDMDNTFSFASGAEVDSNALAGAIDPTHPDFENDAWSTLLLSKLLENNTFRIEFINRFADLLNTVFLPSNFASTMNKMKATLAPEIGQHIARWDLPVDVNKWNDHINFQLEFGNVRPEYQRTHIREVFGLAKNVNATLAVSDISHGYVKINTIDILPSTVGVPANYNPWNGIYFSNVPIRITATPLPGFAFSHWSGASNSSNPSITLTPTANFSLTAHFEPAPIVAQSQTICYWMMDELIQNNLPLTFLNSTYNVGSNAGVLNYQSCLAGYPFAPSDLNNYRKACMERRDKPTTLNYVPEANGNKPYAASGMKGIQITQPFRKDGLENNLVFSFSTVGFKDIRFDIAALDEGAASGVLLEYSVNAGLPQWKTTGLAKSSFNILNAYQLIEADFTGIAEANNNPDFKVRLRFTGPNMTAEGYKNVTFNNARLQGVPLMLGVGESTIPNLLVYPNPVKNMLYIMCKYNTLDYKIYSIEGKLVMKGKLDHPELNVLHLPAGLYILKLKAESRSAEVKFLKN